MKNSKNKILAAVICGMVIGSIGTSIVGNFQSKNISVAGAGKSAVQNTTGNTPAAPSTVPSSGNGYSHEDGSQRGGKGQGKKGHRGEAVITENTESVDVASGNYNDGIYEGTADGFGKNLKVAVTINSGKISDIQIASHNETPGFYEKAFESVPASIIEKQSTNVDTVSGATYSSVGIINAVNNALANA